MKSKAKDKDSSDVKEEDNNSKKELKTTVSRSARSSRGTVSKSNHPPNRLKYPVLLPGQLLSRHQCAR